MQDHWDLITDDESAYKRAYVAEIADAVRRADAGEVGWDAVLTTRGDVASHLLGWRAADHLRRLARAWPSGLATGIRDMLATQDADALWRALLADAGGEAGLKPFTTLASVGARASVASYFLFVHDPVQWPMYRADNLGKPLVKITGEALDKTSPASLLRGYYRALDELHHRLRHAGLPATSRPDAQGVLWVVNSKKVV